MKIITLFLGFLISSYSIANAQSDWLKQNNPNGYFPINANYLSFPNLCNEQRCFNLVAVSYITSTNKGIQHIAVFSKSGIYLGVYSGFNDLPVRVSGSKLVFPKSEYGYIICFSGNQPPTTAYIDGEHFTFESES